MIRYGKIARLHAHIQSELGERMERGEGGAGLLAWLNALPQVKQVLKEEFGGVPISKQNLSEWRQGGYRDWRAHRDTMTQVRQLVSDSQDLEEFMDEKPLADHLATLVAVRYAAALSNTDEEPDEQWERKVRALRGLLRDIIDLRRSDHNAQRLKMERERWEFERRKLAEQAEKQERYRAEDRVLAPFNAAERAAQLTEAFGGSEAAQRVAARAAEVGYDLPSGFLSRKDEPAASSGSELPAKVLADDRANGRERAQRAQDENEDGGSKVDGGETETSNIERPTSNVDLAQGESNRVLVDPQSVKASHMESNQSQTLVKACQDESNSLAFSGLPPVSAEPSQTESKS